MKVASEIRTIHTRHAFTIARGGSSEWRSVIVRLLDRDGMAGWGEAAPRRYYGETPESVCGALEAFAPVLEHADAWAVERIEGEMHRVLGGNAAAKSAVIAALYDLLGQRLGAPLWKVWGLDPGAAPMSSFTIGVADEPELRRKVREAERFPVLKVKLGTAHDLEILRVVREEAPTKVLRVDANAAWSAKRALAMTDALLDHGVELLEQPLPADDIDGLRFVRERSPLPIIADESCLTARDIPRLQGVVDGVNIKLAKCGGPREAMRMVHVARAHGMRVMLGCMVETSLGITTAAHLAPLVDDADLDGAALLIDDPFCGAAIDGGTLSIPSGPGLGVVARSGG